MFPSEHNKKNSITGDFATAVLETAAFADSEEVSTTLSLFGLFLCPSFWFYVTIIHLSISVFLKKKLISMVCLTLFLIPLMSFD